MHHPVNAKPFVRIGKQEEKDLDRVGQENRRVANQGYYIIVSLYLRSDL